MTGYLDIISGRSAGPLAVLARSILRVFSWLYLPAIAVRNAYYDHIASPQLVDRPCISIGNLTAGGTGKTPMVIWLAQSLIDRGYRVAIVCRGYKGDGQGNDELLLMSKSCPRAICIANPDRVAASRYAIAQHRVDVILLDDAFQHRQIGRDLDVVLVDASCPFGHGFLLPRGLLREPLAQLKRADVVVLTHISHVTAENLAQLKTQCAGHAPQPVAVVGCNHLPVDLITMSGGTTEIAHLAGRSMIAFAGIGHPTSFEQTLDRMGAHPLKMIAFDDHHHYTVADAQALAEQAQLVGAELLVTTEKDLVKLQELAFDWPVPLWALRIVIDFVGDGGKMLSEMIAGTIKNGAEEDAAPLPTD